MYCEFAIDFFILSCFLSNTNSKHSFFIYYLAYLHVFTVLLSDDKCWHITTLPGNSNIFISQVQKSTYTDVFYFKAKQLLEQLIT